MTVPLSQSAGLRWLITGASLAIVGGIMLPVALFELGSASATRDWPTVPGIVEVSGVREVTSGSGRLGVDRVHLPDVRYRYTVNGRDFRGQVVQAGKGPDDLASARQTAARYPVGASVPVHVDPADPSRAVLEPDHQARDVHAALATGVGLILGLACLMRFRRLRLREQAPAIPATARASREPKPRRKNRSRL